MTETWLPVVGYEGLYEVSDLGRVKSLAKRLPCRCGKNRQTRDTILKIKPGTNGYLKVTLSRKRVAHTTTVHVLVLRAFHGAPAPGQEALHGDDIRGNCALSNLRWGTHAENMREQMERNRRPFGDRHHNSKILDEVVGWIHESSQTCPAIAHALSVNTTAVWKIRVGESRKAQCATGA